MIETARLRLRRLEPGDVDELVALYADPQVRRFIPGAERYSHRQALARVEGDERHWDEKGQRFLAVVERESDRFLGRVMLYDWPQFEETEVGWILAAPARGLGYATEAGAATLSWGFAHLSVPYITAMVHPDNFASLAVAERLGMEPLRNDVLFGQRAIVHSVSRAQWERHALAVTGATGG